MLNVCTIMGRLTQQPELRKTNGGASVTSFALACDRDRKDKDTGERATDFIDVVVFGHTAEFVAKYFGKGQQAVVVGRLRLRDWIDKEGNKRRSAEVVADNVYFADTKKSREGDSYNTPTAYGGTGVPDASYGNPYSEFVDDDDCPF